MPRQITPRTTLENLKREAKRWLKALLANDAEERARFDRAHASPPAVPTLRDVQHALAIEHGLPGWSALKQLLGHEPPIRRYERVAEALVTAFRTGEADAMHVVWDYFGHMRTWEVTRRYVRLDLGRRENPQPDEIDDISTDDARLLVARAQGFENWNALAAFATALPAGKTIAAKSIGAFTIDDTGERQIALRTRDWDELVDGTRERKLEGIHAAGQMTDELLDRVSRLEHLTALDLDGSQALTDDGLRHLARLQNLRHLNLGGCGGITDHGLAVLRRLPALETINLTWTHTTDTGAANLAACDALKSVDLSGTRTGDGAIRALAGKQQLSDMRTGNAVTDAGLALLKHLPVFREWRGGEERIALMRMEARPNLLMLRGSFTDAGMRALAELEGLFALNVDNEHLAITGAALAPLVGLPHLEWLAFDAKDESMSYIAALPRLRFLMCQDTVASDDGFVALGRSRTIEHIWGRRCYNLRRRGFLALSEMPALRSLSVSCKNVDDEGLSALPRFPALTELMPMDVPDAGYEHVGRCSKLETLTLMYCRDTTDAATEHITGLPRLKKYFASYNQMTDRTPELLSGISSLEEITFDACSGLTNEGIAALARLPRLGKLTIEGMPRVTREVVYRFPRDVTVRYMP